MKITIIDGNNLGMRALGQAPLWHNGQRVEVIFIGLNMLRRAIETSVPDRAVVVWDGGRDPWRLQLYPEYKKKKAPTEKEAEEKRQFYAQASQLPGLIQGLGIEQYKLRHREADDVIYSLMKNKFFGDDDVKTIVSTDADMLQLLADFSNVRIYAPHKEEVTTPESFELVYGFPPKFFRLYKAMVGDHSDNLPGVKGFGPKKAKQFIDITLKKSDLTEEQMKKLALMMDTDQLELMLKLIGFMWIEVKEMSNGRIAPVAADIHEFVSRFSEEYGFNRILEKLDWWILPFEQMMRRGAA